MSAPVHVERITFDDANKRTLFAVAAHTVDDLPKAFVFGTRYFVAFIAWDSRGVSTGSITKLARVLLDSGCVYFCCWGPGCERVHDIVDDEYLVDGLSVNDDESTIMTTWHTRESLEEALWFCLNAAFPDDRFFEQGKTVVGITIGDSGFAARVSAGLRNPSTLYSCSFEADE
jgi:hypothetical protein